MKKWPWHRLLLPILLVTFAVPAGCTEPSASEVLAGDAVIENRGTDSIIFARGSEDNSLRDTYYALHDFGSKPVKIEKPMSNPTKSPTDNSVAYFVPFSPSIRNVELGLYDFDTNTETVFDVEITLEQACGCDLGKNMLLSWSPDGKSVYLGTGALNVSGPPQYYLFRFQLDGTGCTQISIDEGAETIDDFGNLAVSPSGKRILLGNTYCGDIQEDSVKNIRRILPISEDGLSSPVWLNDQEVTFIEGPENNLGPLKNSWVTEPQQTLQ